MIYSYNGYEYLVNAGSYFRQKGFAKD